MRPFLLDIPRTCLTEPAGSKATLLSSSKKESFCPNKYLLLREIMYVSTLTMITGTETPSLVKSSQFLKNDTELKVKQLWQHS